MQMRAVTLCFLTSIMSMSAIANPLDQLKHVQEGVASRANQHALTQAKLHRVTDTLQQQQRNVLRKAAAIQRLERDMAQDTRDMKALFAEEKAKSAALHTSKAQASKMVSAAWSMKHRPQLAAWLLPEETRQQALTSRAIHMTSAALKMRMHGLTHKLDELSTLQETIRDRQAYRQTNKARLARERKQLQSSLEKQQSLFHKLKREEGAYEKEIALLSKEARTLESLVGTVETARTNNEASFLNIYPVSKPGIADNAQRNAATKRQKTKQFTQAKGVLSLPAEGRITGRYGQKRGKNDRLKGLELATLERAMVITPYQGEVLYTGSFLDYGNMVIIRHSQQYHTLVAGLSQIHVTIGQFLLDGEPIGVMGETNDQRNLYLELRKQSKAIDPEPWFAIQKHHYAKR